MINSYLVTHSMGHNKNEGGNSGRGYKLPSYQTKGYQTKEVQIKFLLLFILT